MTLSGRGPTVVAENVFRTFRDGFRRCDSMESPMTTTTTAGPAAVAPAAPTRATAVALRPVPLGASRITGGFCRSVRP